MRRELLAWATEELAKVGVETPGPDSHILLAHVLGVSRTALALIDDVDPEAEQSFRSLVAQRRLRRPLQHLIGSTVFRYSTLVCGPGAFVPRPETEVMVGWCIDQVQALAKPALIVDLCTGSGAIAAALADELTQAHIIAVELDEGALPIAQQNLLHRGVELVAGDMATALSQHNGAVDLVVCNPPYIPLDSYDSVAIEARDFDPDLALWSGEDGLDAFRVLEVTASRLLRPGGLLAAEHADVQGESAQRVFSASGLWTQVRDHEDMAGRPRFVTARLAR